MGIVTDSGAAPPAESAPSRRSRISRIRAVVVAWIVLFLIFALSPNVLPRGDAALSVPTARSLVHDLDLDLSEYADTPAVIDHYGVTDVDGVPVDFFPWLNSVGAIPVVLVVDAVSISGLAPSTDDLIRQDRGWIVHYIAAAAWSASAAVATALLSLRLWQLSGLAQRYSVSRLPTVVVRWPLATVSILVGLTTQFWSITSRSLSAHGPSSFCVALALALVLGDRGRSRATVLAGVLCAVAVWIRPATVVATLTAVAILLMVFGRWPQRLLVGLAAAHGTILLANFALLGRWAPPYFQGGRVGIHSEYVEALTANLVSPARGLLVYCPQLILVVALLIPSVRDSISPRARACAVIMLGSASAVLLLVSGFGFQWWAGHTYGPRFMTDALPFLIPVALLCSAVLFIRDGSTRAARYGLASLWIVAGLIHFQGGTFHSTQCWNARDGRDIDQAPELVWSVEEAQLISGVRVLLEDGPATALWAACE